MGRGDHQRGLGLGLAAAVTFGAGAPVAKLLLDDVSPQVLAGLLYISAFVALIAVFPLRRGSNEAHLRRSDLPRLSGLVLAGGVLAPVLLLIGLERISGTSGSLLLNLEGPFTLAIGLAIFGEHLARRAALGAVVVFAGGALLSWPGAAGPPDLMGALCITAACVLWGIDNNLTQTLTLRDPFTIALVKAGAAGTVNLAMALTLGADLPALGIIAAAAALGAVSYGLSIVLDTYALRTLGAAREAAIFAAAPFVGALLAVPLLSETLSRMEILAGVVMAVGVALLISERHEHIHDHGQLEHEHIHLHDEHHRHEHPPGTSTAEPHSHVHRHERQVHSHEHVSDVHHRHRH